MSEGVIRLPNQQSVIRLPNQESVALPTTLLSNEKVNQIRVPKLNCGMYYAFQLSVRNACGETVSPIQWFQTQASVPATPSPPRCVAATNNSISLEWDALTEEEWNGSPVDSYLLQLSEGGGDWNVIHNDATLSLSFLLPLTRRAVASNLRPNTTYQFRLCAHNGEGNSPFTPPVEFISLRCTSPTPSLPRHRAGHCDAPTVRSQPDGEATHRGESVSAIRARRDVQ